METIRKALTLLGQGLALLAAAAVGITALLNVVEVVSRYVFSAPLNWGADAGAYALCATVFLALPEVTRRHGHTGIALLLEQMPERMGQRYHIALMVVTGLICLVVAWFTVEVALQQIRQGSLTAAANQIPRWWLTAMITVGIGVSAINFIVFAASKPKPLGGHAE